MRYQLKQIYCRPWTLSGLSLQLLESHYENNYGGALRRLNAITAELESLDFAKAPGYRINGLKREELVALNSVLLHELYFASLGGDGRATGAMSEALARDFGSVQRWRTEFTAMTGGAPGQRWPRGASSRFMSKPISRHARRAIPRDSTGGRGKARSRASPASTAPTRNPRHRSSSSILRRTISPPASTP